jgi:hypothetical protein
VLHRYNQNLRKSLKNIYKLYFDFRLFYVLYMFLLGFVEIETRIILFLVRFESNFN